jgi:hypothetical protein
MLKQGLFYLILSIIVVAFARYAHLLVVYLDIFYTYLNVKFTPLFSTNEAGILLRSVIILTLLPIAITTVPALVYRALKGKLMPYYFEATWIVWFTIVISKIIIV